MRASGKVERLSRHLGREDLDLYHRLRRWHADVGDMLSFLAAMLTARGRDAIRADNFRVVREMLERQRRTH